MNDELRNLLAEYLRNNREVTGGYTPPPEPGGPGPDLPQMSLQSRWGANPAIGAGYGMPMGAGDISLRGEVHKPNAQAPANWNARFGYHRSF